VPATLPRQTMAIYQMTPSKVKNEFSAQQDDEGLAVESVVAVRAVPWSCAAPPRTTEDAHGRDDVKRTSPAARLDTRRTVTGCHAAFDRQDTRRPLPLPARWRPVLRSGRETASASYLVPRSGSVGMMIEHCFSEKKILHYEFPHIF
jgi:hypothetical protein